jgi:uncharacterized protein (DUF433 family)
MSTAAHYPHISFDAAGAACVDGSGYKVLHLAAEHFQHGWSAEELLRQHPDLQPGQVYSAMAYFYDHFESMVAELEASAARAEVARLKEPLSRTDLLSRRS